MFEPGLDKITALQYRLSLSLNVQSQLNMYIIVITAVLIVVCDTEIETKFEVLFIWKLCEIAGWTRDDIEHVKHSNSDCEITEKGVTVHYLNTYVLVVLVLLVNVKCPTQSKVCLVYLQMFSVNASLHMVKFVQHSWLCSAFCSAKLGKSMHIA